VKATEKMSDQDWDVVVLHRKKTRAETGRTPEQAAARAMQRGESVATERRNVAGANKQRPGPRRAAAIDVVGTDKEPEHIHRKSPPLLDFIFCFC